MTKDDVIKAIEGERVNSDETGDATDIAYNVALDHAIEAVRALPDEGWSVEKDRKAFVNWLLWDEGDPQKNEDLSFAINTNIKKQIKERGGIATFEIFKLIADAYERGDHLPPLPEKACSGEITIADFNGFNE